MIQIVSQVLLVIAAMVAIVRPVWALAMVITMYALEQLLQSGGGIFLSIPALTNITAAQIRDRIGPLLVGGMDASKLQVKLRNNTGCGAAPRCWQSEYSNYANGVRRTPAFYSSANPEFNMGVAGDSQYLTVYYPLPAFSSIWSSAPTATVNGERVFGILSTAMWINDPSVSVFRATR
jgi:hypothetical protein